MSDLGRTLQACIRSGTNLALRGGCCSRIGVAMAHSPHRQHKGCQLCKSHKNRRHGRAVREPWPVLRKIGKKRRVRRGDLGDE